jgi:beta-lactamase class A
VAVPTAAPAQAPAAPPPQADVSARASPAEVALGDTVSVSGAISPALAAPVALEADPYPYRNAYRTLTTATAAADGSYTFAAVALERNTHLRVALQAPGGERSHTVTVTVDPRVAVHAADLGPGRARLSMRLEHGPHAGPASPVPVSWFVARHGGRWQLAAVSSSRELVPGTTYASATVDPPAARFRYRVCLAPGWEGALARVAAGAGACAGLHYQGHGRGRPLAAYPSAGAVAAAERYLAARAGRTSFAVIDSAGHLAGLNTREHFETASVVKVMMLIALLQKRAAEGRSVDAADRALLYPMIHISDNQAASAVLGIVGEDALERVAREAGMRDSAPGRGWWAFTQTSAADQAHLMLVLPSLVPPRFYPYARGLLAGIEPSQSWGIPAVARPRGWHVFFKTGQLPSRGLFNEVARLERGPVTFTVAVLTDGDPSMAYGQQTIAGVGAALVGL